MSVAQYVHCVGQKRNLRPGARLPAIVSGRQLGKKALIYTVYFNLNVACAYNVDSKTKNIIPIVSVCVYAEFEEVEIKPVGGNTYCS